MFQRCKASNISAISALLVETQNSLIVIAHLVRWTKNLLTDISLSVKKMQFTQNIDTLLKWEHMLIIMWSLLEIIDNRKAIIFNVLLRLWNDNHCTKGPKMIDGLSFGAYTWHKLLDIYSFFFVRWRQSGITNIQLSCFLKKYRKYLSFCGEVTNKCSNILEKLMQLQNTCKPSNGATECTWNKSQQRNVLFQITSFSGFKGIIA